MTAPSFSIGAFVRFNHLNGSTGKVIENQDGWVVVEWVYGKDKRGELMTGRSRFHQPRAEHELLETTEEEYQKIAAREGFGI